MKIVLTKYDVENETFVPPHLFVIPMTRMLLSWSTPSILERSWFTTVSFTPLLLPA